MLQPILRATQEILVLDINKPAQRQIDRRQGNGSEFRTRVEILKLILEDAVNTMAHSRFCAVNVIEIGSLNGSVDM